MTSQPTRTSWQRQFQILLEKGDKVSQKPVVQGIHSTGHPSFKASEWVDMNYRSEVSINNVLHSLAAAGSDVELFERLGKVIPPGGSMMVAYRMFYGEEQIHRDTREALDMGIPPALTPIGYLMFRADCGWSFRDWYFAEGGREGPEKLQGFKPVSDMQRKEAAFQLVNSLTRFLENLEGSSKHHETMARSNAQAILRFVDARF